MSYSLEDFIDRTNALDDPVALFELYKEKMATFGLDHIVYTFLTPHHGQEAKHGIFHNYPQEWLDYYNDNNYLADDPVVLHGLETYHPFLWSDVSTKTMSSKQKKIMRECDDAGLHQGLVIPLRRKINELSGIGGASSQKTPLNLCPNTLRKIQFFTEQFHYSYCRISNQNAAKSLPLLTDKQLEVLKWLAAGKTGEEVAIIMNISHSTVKFHSKNIRCKFKTNDQNTTVIKALQQGILDLYKIKV